MGSLVLVLTFQDPATPPFTGRFSDSRGRLYLIVFAGVSQQVSEEVEAGALAHQDEVGGAVGQVGGGRQAFGAAGTRAAHAGRVDGQELPPDCPPLAVALCKGKASWGAHTFSATALCWLNGQVQATGGGADSPPSDASSTW